MKKLFLCICAAAIVALAAVNLNFALNGDSKVDLSLVSVESLAQNEGEGGNGSCDTSTYSFQNECGSWSYIHYCTSGSSLYCTSGRSDFCGPFHVYEYTFVRCD